MQMVKNQAYDCVILFVYDNVVNVPESVHAPWGAVGLGRCLVLWCSIFLPVLGAECHTGLLLWLCRHPKLSTV